MANVVAVEALKRRQVVRAWKRAVSHVGHVGKT